MSEANFLLVDAGSLINLFRAGGVQALSLLTQQGGPVVILQDILDEIERGNDGAIDAVRTFMDANTSNGRVVKLDYKLIDDVPTLPGEFGDSGDDAIRRILQGNTPEARRALTAISSETPTFRLLTDDGKFFGQLKADGSFKEGALAKYHMKTMPYQGSFEFLKLSLGSNRLWQISETAKAPRE